MLISGVISIVALITGIAVGMLLQYERLKEKAMSKFDSEHQVHDNGTIEWVSWKTIIIGIKLDEIRKNPLEVAKLLFDEEDYKTHDWTADEAEDVSYEEFVKTWKVNFNENTESKAAKYHEISIYVEGLGHWFIWEPVKERGGYVYFDHNAMDIEG